MSLSHFFYFLWIGHISNQEINVRLCSKNLIEVPSLIITHFRAWYLEKPSHFYYTIFILIIFLRDLLLTIFSYILVKWANHSLSQHELLVKWVGSHKLSNHAPCYFFIYNFIFFFCIIVLKQSLIIYILCYIANKIKHIKITKYKIISKY